MQNEKIEILLIENEPSVAVPVAETFAQLQQEFSLQVRNLSDGLTELRNRSFGAVLVDLGHPDSPGMESVLAVHDLSEPTPVVVLIDRDDEEAAKKRLGIGIEDYLVKGEISSSVLVRSIRYAMDRKQAAEALRLSEARYQTLYRDYPAMIFTLDAQGTILSANPTCTTRLGYAMGELEGQPDLKLFHEDDRPAVADQMRICLQNPGAVYGGQFRKIRQDGKPVWVEQRARAVYDRNGSLNILVVCQDVTERKKAMEEIERLNADLAVRAAQLEATNRELEAFNYAVAHDLRKPLTSINGYCQVLLELCSDRLDGPCVEYLQEVCEGTWRMNRLIDILLEFSRLIGVELRRESVDLSKLAQEVAAELQLADPERKVTLRIADGIVAEGDAELLRVVLDNLISNAWKYTGTRDEAIIEFDVRVMDGRETYFVRDNGTGFDMADAENLFIPFQRLPGSEEFRGFGIGLATVDRILRRHGGRVWAEGEPGKGATFYFTLPAE